MLVKDLIEIVNGKLLSGGENLNKTVGVVGGADDMDEVMRLASKSATLVTGCNKINMVKTCSVVGIICIILIRGAEASEELLKQAKKFGIILISTDKYMYETCGRIFVAAGLCGR